MLLTQCTLWLSNSRNHCQGHNTENESIDEPIITISRCIASNPNICARTPDTINNKSQNDGDQVMYKITTL